MIVFCYKVTLFYIYKQETFYMLEKDIHWICFGSKYSLFVFTFVGLIRVKRF